MDKPDSIAWHEINLKNFNKTLERKQEKLAALQKEIKNMHMESVFRQYQIDCAKKEGKASFSADRYKIKDKPDRIE